MSNIKIRELTDLEINERVPQNWLATATSEEAGLDRFTRRATWIDVFSGVAPIYSGDFNFGNFTGGLQVSGNDVLTGVPIATYTSLGVVQIGDNLSITEEGVLSTFPEYQLPPATRSELGGIIVGDTLDIQEDGTLNYNLPIAQKEDVSLPPIGGVIIGQNLEVDQFGVISANDDYILPVATESILGGIKVGDHLQIKNDGELSVKEGSHTVTGVVKIGDTLTFTGDNYLSYELPPAIDFDGTNTRPLGGVIIGENLTVADGVLHGNPDYELPIAAEDTLGGIKVGDNLTIDEGGKLNGNPDYQLPCATTTRLGGIEVGDYLSINDCKLSPDIMGGATESADGDPGIVPQPLKDSKDYIKVLRGDGSWVRICHTQTDAPINPKDGTLWFDTSVMELYVYVEGQSAWFQANGPACCGDGGGGGLFGFSGLIDIRINDSGGTQYALAGIVPNYDPETDIIIMSVHRDGSPHTGGVESFGQQFIQLTSEYKHFFIGPPSSKSVVTASIKIEPNGEVWHNNTSSPIASEALPAIYTLLRFKSV